MEKITRLVLASNNPGKAREVGQILSPLGIEVVPQSDFKVPEVAETGLSFVENALIKARHAARYCNLPVLADDSGLAVDALGGAPGIYSARYAGADANDNQNNEKLLDELDDFPDEQREAAFICAMVLLRHAEDPVPIICLGQWRGQILREPRGENGFGYDPLFFVPDQGKTSAELPAETKNRLSHRGQALTRLLEELKGQA